MKSFNDNKTWILTTLPTRKKVIGSKWVFRIKYKADGNIERHKIRLVVERYNQIKGVDYMETFNFVTKMTKNLVSVNISSN